MQVGWNQNRELADVANAAKASLLSSSQCVLMSMRETSQRASARAQIDKSKVTKFESACPSEMGPASRGCSGAIVQVLVVVCEVVNVLAIVRELLGHDEELAQHEAPAHDPKRLWAIAQQ